MAFTFRGERLLQWRRLQEEQARKEFLRVSESAREAAQRLDEAQAAEIQAGRDYVTAISGGTDVNTIERYRIWITRHQRAIGQCRQVLNERQAVADKAKGVLQVATRHVKMMERLRERAVARYRDAERQEDMKRLDELAVQQHARRGREGVNRGH